MSSRPARRHTDMSATVSTRIHRIGRVIVTVADQDRAIGFYCDTLGFEKTADVPYGDGHRWVEVTLPGTETSIGLTPPMGGPVGVMTGISLDVDDAAQAHADLKGAGVGVDDLMPAADGAPAMFFFRDPDGNTLHVVQV